MTSDAAPMLIQCRTDLLIPQLDPYLFLQISFPNAV
jgi:hypothetical protein